MLIPSTNYYGNNFCAEELLLHSEQEFISRSSYNRQMILMTMTRIVLVS